MTSTIEHAGMPMMEDMQAFLASTANVPEMDDIVSVAAALCETAGSAITLARDERVFTLCSNLDFKVDLPARETFCSRTVLEDELLEVADAREDARFSNLMTVAVDGGIRFYAGVPFSKSDGTRVGALCVFDQQPRTLTDLQRKTLVVLARQVTARLRDHEQRHKLNQALRDAEAAHRAMRASEHRFNAFIDGGPFVAFMKDADGRMLYINKKYRNTIQARVPDMVGKTDAELWPPEVAARFRKADLEVLSSGQPKIGEDEGVGPDGSRVHWRFYKFPISDGTEKLYLGGLAIDVTEDRQREEEIRRMQEELQAANDLLRNLAMTDPLTGVQNRRAFDQRLEEESAAALRHGKPLTMLLLDVDHFKRHNDLFGHAAGDMVLKEVAHVLKTVSRREDVIGRLGGEEFAIILPNSAEDAGKHLASRILRAIHAFPWQHSPVTVSAGIAELMPSQTPAALLETADQAMYAAKHQGRDRTVCASELATTAA